LRYNEIGIELGRLKGGGIPRFPIAGGVGNCKYDARSAGMAGADTLVVVVLHLFLFLMARE